MERATAVQDKEISNSQQLNEDNRFPFCYPECPKSYKYNESARRKHEASHDPPGFVPEERGEEAAKDKENFDDVYNYNFALVSEGLLFIRRYNCRGKWGTYNSSVCFRKFVPTPANQRCAFQKRFTSIYLD